MTNVQISPELAVDHVRGVYHHYTDSVKYDTARDRCADLGQGYTLVMAKTQEEHDDLEAALSHLSADEHVWIGLDDSLSEGTGWYRRFEDFPTKW